MNLKSTLPFTFIAAALLLAACSTAPRQATKNPPTPSAAQPKTNQNLRKGMTETEIRGVWGDPKEVHDPKEGERVLVYQFDVQTTQRMVATTMLEIPTFDPISGVALKVMEPQLSPQKVTVYQTIVLLLREGQLAGWHRQLGEQRSFN